MPLFNLITHKQWSGEGKEARNKKSEDPLSSPAKRAHLATCSAAGALNSGLQQNYRGGHTADMARSLSRQKFLAFPSANHTPQSNFNWKATIPNLKGNQCYQRKITEQDSLKSACEHIGTHMDRLCP